LFDDAVGVTTSFDFQLNGTYQCSLKVTDTIGQIETFTQIIYVNEDLNPPMISEIKAEPQIQIVGDEVNITCVVIDNYDIAEVRVNISYPDGSIHNISMIENDGYYYSATYSLVGIYEYYIWAIDSTGNGNLSIVQNFEIMEENVPPQSSDDQYSMMMNTVLHVIAPGVLFNDDDVDNGPDTLTAVLQTSVTHGAIGFHDDGSFTYYPDVDFFGVDYFTYKAFDGQDYSLETTVIINVNFDQGVLGDMNNDHKFNSGDVRYLALFIAGDPDYSPLYADGDVNSDGKINSGDVRYLALNLAGDPDYMPLYP